MHHVPNTELSKLRAAFSVGRKYTPHYIRSFAHPCRLDRFTSKTTAATAELCIGSLDSWRVEETSLVLGAAAANHRRHHGRCARSTSSVDGGSRRSCSPGPAADRLLQSQVYSAPL